MTSQWTTVYRKELLDVLRDRRTVISMIIVPLLLMPVLMVGIGLLSVTLIDQVRQEAPKIAVVGGGDSPEIVARLKRLESVQVAGSSEDFKERIRRKELRAAVEIPKRFDRFLETGRPAEVVIHTYQGDLRSRFAAETLDRFFRDLSGKVVRRRLKAKGLPTELAHPLEVHRRNVVPPEQVGGSVLGGAAVYLLIILCLTGAMYPAMDLTAGEKERGTIETILASPVARNALAGGKFLVVFTTSLASGLLGMVSCGLTFLVAKRLVESANLPKSPIPSADLTSLSLDPVAMAAVFLMILPVAVLFSALLLAIALFAKSFKEAQSYISPLMIVVILPAAVALLPGVEMKLSLALIPVLNASLVSKEILAGIYSWGDIAIVFFSTCLYAAVALKAAIWLFNQEGVLFRS